MARYDWLKYKSTVEYFIKRANDIHNGLYDYSYFKYVSYETPSWIICKRCGCAFLQSPYQHLSRKRGCSICNQKEATMRNMKTTEEFKHQIDNVYKGFFILDKTVYNGRRNQIIVTCPIHGDIITTPENLLNGYGCKFCNMTKLETEIFNMLRSNNIDFIYEANKKNFKWIKGLSLDFFLPKYNVAIECQGIQHFEPIDYFGGEEAFNKTIIRDKHKFELCKENGITLLYYSNYKKDNYISNIFNNSDELLQCITENKN